jgi:transcriptional repressor NrdR
MFAPSRVAVVRCPQCAGLDDRVVDSRTSEEGATIRRRRECLACGRRFTTYERLEEMALLVVKRSGLRQPFDRAKVVDGVRAAAKNRPVPVEAMETLAGEVEENLRMEGAEVSSQDVGLAVLVRLREVDDVAYLRFASVYKDFRDVEDFRREVGDLIKQTAPKPVPGG